MITACAQGLHDARLAITPEISPKIGIVTGVSHIPSKSTDDFRKSIAERGYLGLSSHALSKIVMNAAMGAVCEVHSIKGPSITLASAEGAGLFSAAYAALCLCQNHELEYITAVSGDELGEIPLGLHHFGERAYFPTEGAGCVVLSRSGKGNTKQLAKIKGIGISGANYLSSAIRQAIGDYPLNDIDTIFSADDGIPFTNGLQTKALEEVWGKKMSGLTVFNPASVMGYADASTSLFSLILAVNIFGKYYEQGKGQGLGLVKNPCTKILVITVNKINGSCAILIEAPTASKREGS
jgi:hypothetical protein